MVHRLLELVIPRTDDAFAYQFIVSWSLIEFGECFDELQVI